MNQILVEAPYIGSCSFWSLLLGADKVLLERHEHFVKRSYRNRAHILGANGLLRLSIPLKHGKHQHAPMKDIRISYKEAWQKLHWQSFTSAYRRSPFFEFYEETFRPFYTEEYEFLFDYNFALLKTIASLLKAQVDFSCTERYNREAPECFEDRRSFILPGKMTEAACPSYPQVFSDRFEFVRDLCILDLLFNAGNRSREYLPVLRYSLPH